MGETGNLTSQILFLAFYLVREKREENKLQIKVNQTGCKLIKMGAFLLKQSLGLMNHVQNCHIS